MQAARLLKSTLRVEQNGAQLFSNFLTSAAPLGGWEKIAKYTKTGARLLQLLRNRVASLLYGLCRLFRIYSRSLRLQARSLVNSTPLE